MALVLLTHRRTSIAKCRLLTKYKSVHSKNPNDHILQSLSLNVCKRTNATQYSYYFTYKMRDEIHCQTLPDRIGHVNPERIPSVQLKIIYER